MDKVINWGLLSHPMNWLIVVLMLIIAGTAAHLILVWVKPAPVSS